MGLTEEIKIANICKVQELLLNKEPHLLEHYLDDILQFSIDRSAEIRKTVTGFIEESGLLSTIISFYYTILFVGKLYIHCFIVDFSE